MSHSRSRSASAAALLGLLGLLGLLSGCASSRSDLWRQHFGIRPDEPAINTSAPSCDEYKEYSKYAQQLQEAYHSRATQNRMWIYVAGVLGLAAAAASGGLAAATAAGAGTIALLSLSGGFSAAAFATIDNSDLSKIYTASANRVDLALKESDTQLSVGSRYGDPAACGRALRILKDGVSDARTTLELSRTDTAVGALARAVAQRNALDALIAQAQPSDPTRVPAQSEDLTDLTPKEQSATGQETVVTLTVENIRLDQIAPTDVTVLFGALTLPLEGPPEQPDPKKSPYTYKVKFKAPATSPADNADKKYAPVLLVGKTKRVLNRKGDLSFTYK